MAFLSCGAKQSEDIQHVQLYNVLSTTQAHAIWHQLVKTNSFQLSSSHEIANLLCDAMTTWKIIGISYEFLLITHFDSFFKKMDDEVEI